MDSIVHGATKSQTQLSNFHLTSLIYSSWSEIIWGELSHWQIEAEETH